MKSLADAADVEEILRRVRAVRADAPRRWGTMTPHGMMCHVADALRMALGARAVSRVGGPFGRTAWKWLVLFVPVRWPRGRIRTSPELDPGAGGTAPSSFDADVAEVLALVRRVAARSGTRAWPEHPVFGPMSGPEWLRWAYLHLDHHLRQFGG